MARPVRIVLGRERVPSFGENSLSRQCPENATDDKVILYLFAQGRDQKAG